MPEVIKSNKICFFQNIEQAQQYSISKLNENIYKTDLDIFVYIGDTIYISTKNTQVENTAKQHIKNENQKSF